MPTAILTNLQREASYPALEVRRPVELSLPNPRQAVEALREVVPSEVRSWSLTRLCVHAIVARVEPPSCGVGDEMSPVSARQPARGAVLRRMRNPVGPGLLELRDGSLSDGEVLPRLCPSRRAWNRRAAKS
jgi:hypothetical protein